MEITFIATLMETALVIVLLALFFFMRYLFRKSKNSEKPGINNQVPESRTAKAIVLSIEKVTIANSNLKAKILVQVMPQNGRNFVIELDETLSFSDLAALHTGNTVLVQYDSGNTKVVSLVKAGC